jgi:hypothetical protein
VECGAAIIADASEDRLAKVFEELMAHKDLKFPKLYGDGQASEFICGEMVKHLY